MKTIVQVGDIHRAYESLEKVIDFCSDNGVDAVVCTGDILGNPFNSAQLREMIQSIDTIGKIINVRGQASPEQILSYVEKDSKAPTELKEAVGVYREAEKHFDTVSEKDYARAAEIFKSSKAKVVVVPGNWDTLGFFEHFGNYNVHLKIKEIDGLKFAGYGGSQMRPRVIPLTRKNVPFSENEMYDFLSCADPDIAVLHRPPYSYCDLAEIGGGKKIHAGSFASLAYVLKEQPNILACGDIHEGYGVSKVGSTLVANSGDFGSCSDSNPRGTFFVIGLDDKNYATTLEQLKVENGKIKKVGEF